MEFPDQLAAFRERTRDPGFAGLILLGTEQHNITAGLLLGTLKLQRVAFLTTPETRQFPAYIAGLLNRSPEGWDCPDGDHSSTLQVYRSVKALRAQWSDIGDPAQIAVDVTGGRKPMSVGLEKAAHLLGLTTIYVDSTYWEPTSGKRGPIPGTQFLVIPPNPYTEFGDLEAAEAQRLFNAHDYSGAMRIFAGLAGKVPFPDGLTYATYADLARAYAAWDAFDLDQAERSMVGLVSANIPAPLDRERIHAQAAALKTLVMVARRAAGRGQEALRTLANVDNVLPLLGSLYANARRREDQGRYDTAALLRYRCLELISQHRLATWGVLTERPDLNDLRRRIAHVDRAYRAIEEQLGFTPRGLPQANRSGWVESISLFNGYMLLAALADPLLDAFDIVLVRERSKSRNQSILAHGYRLITAEEYTPFAEVVDELIDRLFRVIDRDRQAWERIFTFVDLT